MATRSIIAVPAKEGYKTTDGSTIAFDAPITWFGRYCHYDGYPEHMVKMLTKIIKRYGVEHAKTRLLSYTWSTIGTDYEGKEINFAESDKIGKYNTGEGFITNLGDKWGTEYLYTINELGFILVQRPEATHIINTIDALA